MSDPAPVAEAALGRTADTLLFSARTGELARRRAFLAVTDRVERTVRRLCLLVLLLFPVMTVNAILFGPAIESHVHAGVTALRSMLAGVP
ncbi:MAG: hypothetical protein LBV50_07585 [Novosphingobium sp.]|jgi:hypothetical protein|nr:hypothetical protein [Novosphingobium sp.]